MTTDESPKAKSARAQAELQAFLDGLDLGEELSSEELILSTPYRNGEAWTQMMEVQRSYGRSKFHGPPGLLERLGR